MPVTCAYCSADLKTLPSRLVVLVHRPPADYTHGNGPRKTIATVCNWRCLLGLAEDRT